MICRPFFSGRASLWLALLACCMTGLPLAACGSDETVVVVSIYGLTSDVSQVGVVARLNGNVVKTTRLSPPVKQVGLRLTAGTDGLLEVGVGGGNSAGCLVSLGIGRMQVHGEQEVQLSVVLEYQSEPDCS